MEDSPDLADSRARREYLELLMTQILQTFSATPEDERPDLYSSFDRFATRITTFFPRQSTARCTSPTPPTTAESEPSAAGLAEGMQTRSRGRQKQIPEPSAHVDPPTRSRKKRRRDDEEEHNEENEENEEDGGFEGDEDDENTPPSVTTAGATAPATRNTNPKKARGSGTRRSSRSTEEISTISFGISRQYSAPRVDQLQTTFYDLLTRIPKTGRDVSDATARKALFSSDKAAQLTTFFFARTMGTEALERIVQFVKAYSQKGEADFGAAGRSQQLAGDQNAPEALRLFFAAFSRQQHARSTRDTVARHVEDMQNNRSLLKAYRKVTQDIVSGDRATMAYLKTKNLVRDHGRGNKTLAKEALSAILDIDPPTLTRICDKAKGIDLIAQKLGDAFILLMPPLSTSFVQSIGTERLGPACDLLLNVCPFIPKIVALIDAYVWTPYTKHAAKLPISISIMSDDQRRTNFWDCLSAATDSRSDEPQYTAFDVANYTAEMLLIDDHGRGAEADSDGQNEEEDIEERSTSNGLHEDNEEDEQEEEDKDEHQGRRVRRTGKRAARP